MEILTLLARANSITEAKALIPECQDIVVRYADAILRHEVSPSELVITRYISKVLSEYRSNTLEASAASQLADAGRELHAGESIGYVITSHRSASKKFRTTPQELISEDTHYDADRYVELLEAACKTVLEPFALEQASLKSGQREPHRQEISQNQETDRKRTGKTEITLKLDSQL